MNHQVKKTILFFLIILSSFLALYCCELYLNYHHFEINYPTSVFSNLGTNNIYKTDPSLIYIPIDNTKYRDPLKLKNSQKTNIAFIGDSVTWGIGAENDSTYSQGFEKLYNQNSSHKKIITNNFGLPGYNLDQEYILIKEKVLPEFQPDIIVWNLNVNDIQGSNYACLFTEKDHQWIQISARQNLYYWYATFKTLSSNFISHSKLFHFFSYQLNQQVLPRMIKSNLTLGCSSLKITPTVQEKIVNKLDYFIKDLSAELQKKNVKLIITLVPYQQYLDKNSPKEQISSDYFVLKKYLNKNHSINFIDFNEFIPKSDNNLNPSEEYFLSDTLDNSEKGWHHPNQKNYNLMASTLYNYFLKMR